MAVVVPFVIHFHDDDTIVWDELMKAVISPITTQKVTVDFLGGSPFTMIFQDGIIRR